MAGIENDFLFGKNADFTAADNQNALEANGLFTDGQLWIGRTAVNTGGTHIDVATLTAGTGISIVNGSGSITISLLGGGVAVEHLTGNTGGQLNPDGSNNFFILGAVVAAGTTPISVAGLASTLTTNVQISQALAATDATKIGLSNFNSAQFTVDPNGFVSVTSGTFVTALEGGPGITITGTASAPIVNSVIFTDTAALTMSVDNGYFATAAGTYNLPATAAQGELIHIVCDTAGVVVVDAPALNFIRMGSAITSSGGTATSSAIGDSLTLRYRLSSLTWYVTASTGIWTLA